MFNRSFRVAVPDAPPSAVSPLLPPAVKQRLIDVLGPRGYLDQPQDLTLYEYDGSVDKVRPEMVVFPATAEQLVEIVRITAEHDIPIVGRGAGTGLSGGAIPQDRRDCDRLRAPEPHHAHGTGE